jgi:hypothetical protein
MTNKAGDAILGHLASVHAQRQRREGDLALAARVEAIKGYQQRRFERTYADLLAHPRYGAAARFFLDELYGPMDFTQRDAQFARVVPALVRLFPAPVVSTVEALADLHATSECFDTAMAEALPSVEIDVASYGAAWRRCGDAPGRARQIALLEQVGRSLDGLTRGAWLRKSLRLMRGPARAAGLMALQGFLETGFDAFRAMGGADEFLLTIVARERAEAAVLFAAGLDTALDAKSS